MTVEKFKMPQSSYEELAKVIKAYGHADQPASLDEVSKLVGLHTTIISRNAGFLTSAGILEPGQKKLATSSGKSLAHALEHEMPEEIRTWWRKIISQTDFLSKVLTAIKIRNGMDSSTLEAHIAYSAGRPKKSQFMTGARTIIDILRAAEVVKEIDGKIVYASAPDAGESMPEPQQPLIAPPIVPAVPPKVILEKPRALHNLACAQVSALKGNAQLGHVDQPSQFKIALTSKIP